MPGTRIVNGNIVRDTRVSPNTAQRRPTSIHGMSKIREISKQEDMVRRQISVVHTVQRSNGTKSINMLMASDTVDTTDIIICGLVVLVCILFFGKHLKHRDQDQYRDNGDNSNAEMK